jgi:lipopolysaccharide/colanic/teichoic acid biosynthesis glycosyltransferase
LNDWIKRGLDIVGALIGLAIFSPAMIVIAILIRSTLGKPVLFRQVRPGLHGRPFTMWKFRTMRIACDADGNPLSDGGRLTRLGQFLREWSLDELPQFWHLLCGQMSLVGPRPLLPEYLPRYTASQARRHEVKPGLTGWSQVQGRNEPSWERRLELDVWYVDHRSFWLDMKILFLTIGVVLRRQGVSQPGHSTVEPFRG